MSVAYDVGFTRRPVLAELDEFMKSLDFKVEQPGERVGKSFTRVYVFSDDSVPREIEFFYESSARANRSFFGKRGKSILAYGSLKTFSTEDMSVRKRLRIMKSKPIWTEHDYYKHLEPGRLRFYETALALRRHYEAIVISEQSGEEINPTRPFPTK